MISQIQISIFDPMHKSYRYELRPTDEQKISLDRAIGSCRFVYNLALETKKLAYQKGFVLSKFDLMKQLPLLKKDNEWLKEVPANSLQEAIDRLDLSYKKFYNGLANFPKFKKKSTKGSFTIKNHFHIDFTSHTVTLPKYGVMVFNRDREIQGTAKNLIISRTSTGRYFMSILFDDGIDEPNSKPVISDTTIGIDLGLKHFAVLSDGRKIENPRFLTNSLKKINKCQRALSRKKKGSNRWELNRIELARKYEKASNQKKDFLHKLSTEITNQYDSIAIENLNIKGLVKNKYIGKHISDAGWSYFEEFLKYKAKWSGKNILQIGRFEPSSRMCTCGFINKSLRLSHRIWTCNSCGIVHDRDVLAANNIKKFGLRIQPTNANVKQ